MKKQVVASAIVMGIALASGMACSSAKDADPTPVKQFKITPSSGVRAPTATSQATSAATATGTASKTTTPAATTATAGPTTQATATSGGGGSTTITLVATNILFDQTKLTAAAGTVKIVLDNKDGGVPHNIQVFEGKDASGKSVGKTDFEPGPVKQELTLDLKAGAYFFQCDVHPTTMAGTLTVS